jgi:hypothetical protein
MLHLLSKPTARDVGRAPSRVNFERPAVTTVLVTEQQSVYSTAAATVRPPTPAHRHWRGTTLITAIGHIHIRLPEPRPIYPRRASYFDDARMSREMDRL